MYMPKSAPKKKAEKTSLRSTGKNTGRPVRSVVQAARAAALKKIEADEKMTEKKEEIVETESTKTPMSSSPQHVVVETGDASGDIEVSAKDLESEEGIGSEATETIAAQNVAHAITAENQSEY